MTAAAPGTVLVTGATGYIGSHTCVELLQRGYDVVGIDNFDNSRPAVVDRIAALGGRPWTFHTLDVRDTPALCELFEHHAIDAAIHFAGLKSVADSVADPLRYYDVNVTGSLSLANAMQIMGAHRLVFSSSATVYGEPEAVPIPESGRLAPASPYGRSKRMVEQMLTDVALAHPQWAVLLLRYFNPVGAHPSARLGEDPLGTPNNLMPLLAQVARGQRESLQVFGSDWPTADGTGVRDYIHVVDLARAHVAALERSADWSGAYTFNIGNGVGTSVLELVRAFEAASGQKIALEFVARRAGDVAEYYADPRLSATALGWRAERDIATMCADAWAWHCANVGDGDSALAST